MKQHLYRVGMKHNTTGERVNLHVWADNVEEATHLIVSAIGGYRGEYSWTGSGPEYQNNQIVTREI